MGRNRVFSFMSQLSAGRKTPSPPPSDESSSSSSSSNNNPRHKKSSSYQPDLRRPVTPPSTSDYGSPVNSPPQRQRSSSRPMSMVQAYQPPVMDVSDDTIPELQPIFSFLNSHSNKLYHEGYFLKLDDQNTQGKPNPDRTWNECFAQLVGTVLSLWDAAELDAVGEDGVVLPKFINLTDASIKMIESLPTRSSDEQPLQNILSISTAGRNRYLLHFNSHDSLIQWTAAIRLAMYEHSTLQEAYTGALIAGMGKTLNNINIILERSRFKTEEWVRVRFGAGVPWRRCWCVITPPDEKEFAKLQKELKKRSAYDRSPVPVLKGDIKFYDTKTEGKKQKKTRPIASISDAYSAYAIYPQAKSLVEASTLIKVEGNIAIHTEPSSSSEGFVFIMPETRPAVSGLETMLHFLVPTWDTFGLYGRPGRLVASVLDSRSLMFAMPKHKRYGYLEVPDVSGLLLDSKSSGWNEREWRKRLKEATGTRMNSVDGGFPHSRSASRTSARLSNGTGKQRVGFTGENDAVQSHHLRSSSGSYSPDHVSSNSAQTNQSRLSVIAQEDRASLDEDRGASPIPPMAPVESMRATHSPEPVLRPPAFSRASLDRPTSKAYHSPELRQANTRLSCGTLDQMAKAGGISIPNGSNGLDVYARDARDSVRNGGPSAPPHSDPAGTHVEALSPRNQDRPRSNQSNQRPLSTYGAAYTQGLDDARPPSTDGRLSPFPPAPISMTDHQALQNNAAPSQNQFGGYRPMSGPRPYPGPDGAASHSDGTLGPLLPPLPPHRKPVSDKHDSITANDIIDHYTTQARDQYDRTSVMPPPPPLHQRMDQLNVQDAYDGPEYPRRSVERPRAGVLKTVGGAEPEPKRDFDMPDFDFGPTINYGAPSVLLKKTPGQRPQTPPNQGPQGPRPQPGHRRQGSVPWQPAVSPPPGTRSPGLTPEQYVQQRAAAAAAPYGHARKLSANTLGGRSSSPSVGSARSMSPQPLYQALGGGAGQAGSFSPLRSGAESPSRGHYRNQSSMSSQYQSKAF